MKRLKCTVSDKRGFNGDCMRVSDSGRYVLFDDHQREMDRANKDIKRRDETLESALAKIKELESHCGEMAIQIADLTEDARNKETNEVQIQINTLIGMRDRKCPASGSVFDKDARETLDEEIVQLTELLEAK